MRRGSFLKRFLAFSASTLAPFTVPAFRGKNSREKKGIMVASGKDRFNKSIQLFEGDTFFTKVATEDTDGDLYIFESTRLKEGGPSLHVHYDQDEWWYILEGEFLIKIGDET